MATIKDVAEYAGISYSTVSRAIRNVGYIHPKTRERVANAAAELGYIPNLSARKLKNGGSDSAGFIIPDINNNYYFQVASSLQKMLNEHGMSLIIAFSEENPGNESDSFRSLISEGVKSLLFTPTNRENREMTRIAKQKGIKVIQMFRDVYDDIDTVINDDEYGCYSAAKALAESGCRRLLLFDVEYAHLCFEDVTPNRSTGFLKAVGSSASLKHCIVRLPLINPDETRIHSEIDRFRPDGIITATNNFGLEVLTFLRETKRSDSIKVITFDDNRWLEFCSVSAVRQDTDALISSVIDMIRTEDTEIRKQTIEQKLIIRRL